MTNDHIQAKITEFSSIRIDGTLYNIFHDLDLSILN